MKNSWISVKEDLPKFDSKTEPQNKKVLAFYKSIGISCGFYWGEGRWNMKDLLYWQYLPEQPEWISVEDELPKFDPQVDSNHKKVLILCKPIGITTGYYWGSGHKNEPSDTCKGWSIMNVLYWQYLPEPPEGFKDIIQPEK